MDKVSSKKVKIVEAREFKILEFFPRILVIMYVYDRAAALQNRPIFEWDTVHYKTIIRGHQQLSVRASRTLDDHID